MNIHLPHKQLEQLHARYLAHLPEKLAELKHLSTTVAADPQNQASRDPMRQIAHRLAGSGGTMGIEPLSETAYALLRVLDLADVLPQASFAAQLDHCVRAVVCVATDHIQRFHAAPIQPLISYPSNNATGRIGFVVPRSNAVDEMVLQLDSFGYPVVVLSWQELLQSTNDYATLIIDLDTLLEIEPQVRQWLKQARIPLIALSERADMAARLQAVRLGADSYLTHPVDSSALVEALDQATARQTVNPPRVLIVDDAAQVAATHSAMLEAAGMVTQVVTEPLTLLDPLAEFQPDLLLIDLYMPECTGLELATVVRQQAAYVSVPIVFLSNEHDRDIQLAALGGGGDDFLTKPVVADQLVPAIRSRIRRARTLRTHITRDSLTGLLNHAAILAQLTYEIERAERCQTPLAVAMLDIDHFKNVNDTYGHPVGDRVLKCLARSLQQRIRSGDSIGRYGGEEFLVVLPGADGATASGMIEEVRLCFGQVWHQEGLRRWQTTVSAGVACATSEAMTSVQIADAALYQAKRNGRNQVVYSQEMASETDTQAQSALACAVNSTEQY